MLKASISKIGRKNASARSRSPGRMSSRFSVRSLTSRDPFLMSLRDGLLPGLDPGRAIGFDRRWVETDQTLNAVGAIGNIGGDFRGKFGLGVGRGVAQRVGET